MRTFGISVFVIFAVLIGATTAAYAHHGWAWTTGGNIDLTGTIKSAKLGNPHGVLKIDVNGEEWTAEIGQPWRNERAGLKPADFAVGTTIRVLGEPSANIEDKRIKAERVYFGEREFILYPERD